VPWSSFKGTGFFVQKKLRSFWQIAVIEKPMTLAMFFAG